MKGRMNQAAGPSGDIYPGCEAKVMLQKLCKRCGRPFQTACNSVSECGICTAQTGKEIGNTVRRMKEAA